MRRLKSTKIIIFLCLVLFGELCIAGDKSLEEPPEFLRLVKEYAETMLSKGRDFYGVQHSPLVLLRLWTEKPLKSTRIFNP